VADLAGSGKIRPFYQAEGLRVSPIRNVLWANPEIEAEQVVPWLKGGAKEEPARRLDFNPAG
jgi:hypothetical protein